MTKKISRKVLPMLAVMALVFALAGCGGSGSPASNGGGGTGGGVVCACTACSGAACCHIPTPGTSPCICEYNNMCQ